MQAIYCEAIAMVEEYQLAVSAANLSGIRDIRSVYPQLGLNSSTQVFLTCTALFHDNNSFSLGSMVVINLHL